jgi:hypothetical protein
LGFPCRREFLLGHRCIFVEIDKILLPGVGAVFDDDHPVCVVTVCVDPSESVAVALSAAVAPTTGGIPVTTIFETVGVAVVVLAAGALWSQADSPKGLPRLVDTESPYLAH